MSDLFIWISSEKFFCGTCANKISCQSYFFTKTNWKKNGMDFANRKLARVILDVSGPNKYLNWRFSNKFWYLLELSFRVWWHPGKMIQRRVKAASRWIYFSSQPTNYHNQQCLIKTLVGLWRMEIWIEWKKSLRQM